MRVTVTADILADEYDGTPTNDPAFFVGYIAGAEPYIVPGVTGWDKVTAEVTGDTVVISADLATDDKVASDHPSGNGGQEVSEQYIREYILGADAYWLAPDVSKATEVTFA